jgi:hypothetical protein
MSDFLLAFFQFFQINIADILQGVARFVQLVDELYPPDDTVVEKSAASALATDGLYQPEHYVVFDGLCTDTRSLGSSGDPHPGRERRAFCTSGIFRVVLRHRYKTIEPTGQKSLAAENNMPQLNIKNGGPSDLESPP